MKSINLFKIWLLLSVLWLTAGCCSYIDDDLSDCPPEGQDYELTYELRLVTNITTELSTQLSTATDVNVANALRDHLKNIFTDFAHDVDLSFYDTENAQERLSHDQHVMNASEQSYTLYLPMREYMHLAAANIRIIRWWRCQATTNVRRHSLPPSRRGRRPSIPIPQVSSQQDIR